MINNEQMFRKSYCIKKKEAKLSEIEENTFDSFRKVIVNIHLNDVSKLELFMNHLKN